MQLSLGSWSLALRVTEYLWRLVDDRKYMPAWRKRVTDYTDGYTDSYTDDCTDWRNWLYWLTDWLLVESFRLYPIFELRP